NRRAAPAVLRFFVSNGPACERLQSFQYVEDVRMKASGAESQATRRKCEAVPGMDDRLYHHGQKKNARDRKSGWGRHESVQQSVRAIAAYVGQDLVQGANPQSFGARDRERSQA